MFINFLRSTVIVVLFAVLFVPVLVADGTLLPNMFFPFITGKALVFRFLVEVATAAWLILILRHPEYRPRWGLLISVFATFVLLLGVSTVLAENPLKSFWSNFERMEGYVTILHLFAYVLVLSSMFSTIKHWRKFFSVSLVANAVVVFYAFIQLAGEAEIHQGGDRLTASLGNAAYLAVYTLIHLFLVAYLWFTAEHKTSNYRWLLGASFMSNMIVLLFTGTRGAVVGLVGGLVVAMILLYLNLKDHPLAKKRVGAALLVLAVLAGTFFALRSTTLIKSSPVLSRYSNITLEDGSVRMMVWRMAWQGFKERPVFGWGQENFNYVFNKYYDPGMHGQEEWFDRAHNVFMDWLIAGGILALLGYLALFGTLIYQFFREKKESPMVFAVMSGLLAAYFIHNLFVFDHLPSYILFFSLFAYGVSRENALRAPNTGRPVSSALFRIGTILVVLIFLFVSIATVFRPAAAAAKIITAISPNNLSPRSNFETFKELSNGPAFARPEVRERLFEYSLAVAADRNVPNDIKKQLVDFTATQFEEQLEATPKDARYHYFFGLFWQQLGQRELAITSFKRALELSPNKQSIMYSLGSVYGAEGDMIQSLEYFKKAFDLRRDLERPRINYAAALVRAGQLDKADAILLEGFGTTTVNSPDLMRAYVDTKQYARALPFWLEEVNKNPNDPEKKLSLAAAYLLAGQRNMAIAEIEKVIAIAPQYKAQGRYLISEIAAGRNPIGQ